MDLLEDVKEIELADMAVHTLFPIHHLLMLTPIQWVDGGVDCVRQQR